ncbi:MAG TPA: hypothetical protein VEC12_10915 [Bacteroidia bacterium]|nr:hypothetical protein [Bacteroidia bacterium]
MLKLFIPIVLFLFLGCKKEEPKKERTCQDEMAEYDPAYLYAALHDIRRLAWETNNPERKVVQLIPYRVDKYYKILDAVRKTGTPQSDSVFNKFRIPYTVPERLQFLTIYLEDSVKSVNDTVFMNLIRNYNLSFHGYTQATRGQGWITMKTCPIINVYALASKFHEIGYHADANGGHGNLSTAPYSSVKVDFYNDTVNNSTKVVFFIGMGDCPSGCQKKYTWEFEVDAGYNAKFIKSYGNMFR